MGWSSQGATPVESGAARKAPAEMPTYMSKSFTEKFFRKRFRARRPPTLKAPPLIAPPANTNAFLESGCWIDRFDFWTMVRLTWTQYRVHVSLPASSLSQSPFAEQLGEPVHAEDALDGVTLGDDGDP